MLNTAIEMSASGELTSNQIHSFAFAQLLLLSAKIEPERAGTTFLTPERRSITS